MALGLADVLVEEFGALDVQEVGLPGGLAGDLGDLLGKGVGDGLGDERLAASGRAVEQDALRGPQFVFLEEVGVEVGELDGVADQLDLVAQAADLVVVDVRDLFEDEFLDLALGDHFVDVAGAGFEQQGVAGADGDVQERLGEPHHPFLVGVPDDQGALAVFKDFLEGDDVPGPLVLHGLDHVERFVEHDLLAAPEVFRLDAGADVHAELSAAGEDVDGAVLVRLKEDTETGRRLCEPVDFFLEGHDLVAGLTEGIRQSFVLRGDAGQIRLELDDPLFENPRVSRRVGELASQDGDFLLEIGNLASGVLRPSPGPDAAVDVVVVGCHGPHLLQGELDAS
ncbi:hypothetical protein GCM10020254_65630 [Streptomyces goshikiensis]